MSEHGFGWSPQSNLGPLWLGDSRLGTGCNCHWKHRRLNGSTMPTGRRCACMCPIHRDDDRPNDGECAA